MMGRLYAAARLYVKFFQPSFKLKEKRREGAKVIKRYHLPSTPYERALAHPKVTAAVKKRLRDQYRSLDPVALLAEMRATQQELGNRVDHRAGQARGPQPAHTSILPATTATFAKTLGKTATVGEPRATHRRTRRPYKTRVRMPSKLDPHIAAIEAWLAEQPQLTALAIVGRLREKYPEEFGKRQHSIVQRLLRALRRRAAGWSPGPARRRHDRCPIAPGCGRLGLCRARPDHSPSRRASRESHLARPINRHRIVIGNDAITVTFADAAIRAVDIRSRDTGLRHLLRMRWGQPWGPVGGQKPRQSTHSAWPPKGQ